MVVRVGGRKPGLRRKHLNCSAEASKLGRESKANDPWKRRQGEKGSNV